MAVQTMRSSRSARRPVSVDLPPLRRINVRLIRNLVGLVIFGTIIQLASMWGPGNWAVPSLAEFVTGAVGLITLPSFAIALWETIATVLIAVAIALALAIMIGVPFGSSRVLRIGFGLPLEILRPIPAFALVPLGILALGNGQPMELATAVFASWWTLFFNTVYGVRQVDRQAVDAARSMGYGSLQIAIFVVVPSLLPFLIAGLRTAMPIAFVVVIGAEYLSTAGRGLGGILIIATSSGDLSVLWATAAITGVLGIMLGGIVALLARLITPWAERKAAQ